MELRSRAMSALVVLLRMMSDERGHVPACGFFNTDGTFKTLLGFFGKENEDDVIWSSRASKSPIPVWPYGTYHTVHIYSNTQTVPYHTYVYVQKLSVLFRTYIRIVSVGIG